MLLPAMRFSPRHDETSAIPAPSKTRIKEAMHELQALGQELTGFSREQLKRMNLDEDLLEAVLEYQRIPRFEARRRQLQYIGKLMRGLEAEPVRAALAAARGESAGEIARQHRLERLREDFLEDETVLRQIADNYPGADLTRLRQLRRAALREKLENRPPKHSRELFRALRELETREPQDDAGVFEHE
jgi:ribosome-associated protein